MQSIVLHGIDLRDIALLDRVAQTGNLSSAARSLGIPPAVASRRLAALEAAVCLRLADRTTRKTVVTAAGRALALTARNMLDEWKRTLSELRPSEGAISGTLRISVPHMFGRSILAPMLASFAKQWPGIRLAIQFSDIPLALANNSLDLAIRIAQPTGTEGIVRKLVEIQKVVVASPEYLKQNGVPLTPTDLCGHHCLVATGRGDWTFELGLERMTVRVTGPIETNDGAFLRDAALHGAGIAMKSWFDVAALVREGLLRRLLAEYVASPDQNVWAIIEPRQASDPKVVAFLSALRGHLEHQSSWQLQEQ